ncbi:MAG: Crp/Fnr family transcriptional regulator [Hasllibacter sp.]
MSESCLVSRLERYIDLTEAERDFLSVMEEDEKPLKAGQTVLNAGSNTNGVFVLKFGWAIVRSQSVRGRSAILRIYLPGEVIGLGELGPPHAPHSILMQTDGTVCPFPRSGIARLMKEEPRLAALLTGLSSLDQIALRDQCAALGLMTAEDRLIQFLLQLRARLAVADVGLGNRFHLPFSQAEIGQAVGMTSVYVNKLIRKLSDEGRLKVERPYIRLMDREGMETQVGFVDRFTGVDKSWFPEAKVA